MNNAVANRLVANGLRQITNQVRGTRAFILVQRGDDLFVSMIAEHGDRTAQLRLLEQVAFSVGQLAAGGVWAHNDAPKVPA